MSDKTKPKTKTSAKTQSKAASAGNIAVKKAEKKSVKKTETHKSAAKKKKKKNTNLLKLHGEMNKMSIDAVDREILRRFKIIIDTNEEDISKMKLQVVLKEPKSIDLKDYHESLQPYIKHYIFMLKRVKK